MVGEEPGDPDDPGTAPRDEGTWSDMGGERTAEDVLAARISAAVRGLAAQDSLQSTLDSTVTSAVAMVDGCSAAGVTLVERDGEVTTPAASDGVAGRGDVLQYELGEGPCLDAVRHAEVVTTDDLADDARWRRWGAAVVDELGVRSMLCVQLFTSDSRHGALNLYAREPRAFTDESRAVATTFAAVAAAALGAARTEERLGSRVQTRTIVGQAQGVLMERHGIGAQQAIDLLATVAAERGATVVELAHELLADVGARTS
ncbi:hypothetical protein GCM10025865_14500 [Paraoerskovia sediminicola]|uniref:ANTAR domain-containing protein n=1 Tax=Paraoerskovia sediminicola TaxID=1138587 RepID=A0ABM8G298_9CELL|nr:GAF and ANTAR domain-containing protein [Paraoerskovia sediminicola]BDZ42151.1 hypothetical protein GCM10025865_14500 [Paraoerskovia sediminicola]